MRTYEALHGYIENLAKLSLTQKGFVIGDGGEETISNVKNVRKEFRTLAFWQGSLKTGADGKVSFEFVAPDNLTTYRIVAVGADQGESIRRRCDADCKNIETAPDRSGVAAFFARRR